MPTCNTCRHPLRNGKCPSCTATCIHCGGRGYIEGTGDFMGLGLCDGYPGTDTKLCPFCNKSAEAQAQWSR
jgi:hypothetical protein